MSIKQSRILLALIILLLSTVSLALAQGPDDILDWWTVDSGGGTWASADGQYVLDGTVGQPDARVWRDGDYTLTGGFWNSGAPPGYEIYLPLVLGDA